MAIKRQKLQPKQLLDLPHDILELIFNEIPYYYLNKMKDIKQIKSYVLSRLYSSIVICDSILFENLSINDHRDSYLKTKEYAEFENVESFIKFIDKN